MDYMKAELYDLIKRDSSIFEFIQESALDGFWYYDMENPTRIWMNKKFLSALGYGSVEYPEKLSVLRNIANKEDMVRANDNLLKHCADPNYPYDQIIRYKHRSGKTVWMRSRGMAIRDADGKVTRMIGAQTDVSDLIRQNDILEQCNTAAKIGFWEIDIEHNTLFWSAETKQIHEVPYDYEPRLPEAIRFFKEGYSRNKIQELVEKAMQLGEAYDEELQFITAKGNEIWVKVIGRPELESGKCIRFYGTFQNINESKKSEQALQALLQVTKSQNERLKNFAYIVSHNLKSHSGNISSLVSLLQDADPELEGSELFTLLTQSSFNLRETISHLSEVALINMNSQEDMQLLSLNKAITEAIQTVSAQAKEAGVVIINESVSDTYVLGIPAYLDSIVLNFMTNAIKYRSLQRQSIVKISVDKSKDYTILSIEDNGLGINMNKHRSKLFGMYKTFHQHNDARGVGLFIAKNQIEAIGGFVEAESQEDIGTTFKIYLKHEKN